MFILHSDQCKPKSYLKLIKIHIFRRWPVTFNPRRAGGGAILRSHPQVFHKYLKNGSAKRRCFSYTCSAHLFRTCCENFRPRSLTVRSLGHVKWPSSEKVWMLVSRHIATSNARSPWNFQRLISVAVSIKRLSRNLNFRDPRSDQCCDLSIISQCDKNERRLFWKKTIRNILKHRVTGRLDTLSRNIATSDPSPCRQGHFRSWKITSSFSAVTFYSDQLEQWKQHRYIQDDHTDRLIYNMTISDQAMTLTWVQTFKMTF